MRPLSASFVSRAFGLSFLCLLTLALFGSWQTRQHFHPTQPAAVQKSPPEKAPLQATHYNDIEQLPNLWSRDIFQSPSHQNPAKAPPVPLLNNSVTLLSGGSLQKRDALRCDDGPCIDGSCCSKDHICGYGPTHCGKGNCTSLCEATAMCGEFSENADMPCGMKLCCSASGWCGTTEPYCGNADPLHGTLPCQAGYGACFITGEPSRPAADRSTDGRKIGYYQSWNVRTRACNKVEPKQLNTDGYTHLYYAFASIDPESFAMIPMHPDDEKRMLEFTDLAKTRNLKTWIAVGGFDFSDNNTATHTTWSDLVSNKANRAAFIASAKAYMTKYGFTGIDLDWEYPGDEKRGGRKLADTRNFPLLLKEMRAAYGTSTGISLTLAPDYWYLRWFDAKVMEPYVDFFGFMAYDLHGSWDTDVLTLGKLVRGQADITEIAKDVIPLWFDGLKPEKINFGLAMYGRGYTLANPGCTDLLCPFSGPSKPGQCTNFEGVMSLREIQQVIAAQNIQPKFLENSLMKQITWGDQWIGYDDDETFARKKAWADLRGFGGTMVWSIDFQVTNTTDENDYGPIFYVGTQVYSSVVNSVTTRPVAQCIGPCNMVFAPSTLPSASTITPAPYTTSLAVGTGSTVVGGTTIAVGTGSTIVGGTTIPNSVTTITIIPPVITITVISYYNYHITSNQSPGALITLFPSIDLPPVIVTVTDSNSKTTTRNLTLPPWPMMLSGPPQSWTSTKHAPHFTPPPLPPVPIPTWPPYSFDLPEMPKVTLPPVPPTNWPPWPPELSIEPIKIDINFPDVPPGPDVIRLPCVLWLFFVCIKWGSLDVKSWDIHFPGGLKKGLVIGPGPPGIKNFKFPPGWHIEGNLPPWPAITIGPDLQPIIPAEPAACETVTATLSIETTSIVTTVSNGKPVTSTTTLSDKFTILGCNLQDDSISTTVTACARPTPRAEIAIGGQEHRVDLSIRAPPVCAIPEEDAILWIDIFESADRLRAKLIEDGVDTNSRSKQHQGFKEIRSAVLKFTAYFYVKGVTREYVERLYLSADSYHISMRRIIPKPRERPAGARSIDIVDESPLLPQTRASNDTSPNYELNSRNYRLKRGDGSTPISSWATSQLSAPPGVDWNDKYVVKQNDANGQNGEFKYVSDDSSGKGQFVYIVEDAFDEDHPVLTGIVTDLLPLDTYGNWGGMVDYGMSHATQVACIAVSRQNGVVDDATLIGIDAKTVPMWDIGYGIANFIRIESLLAVVDDIVARGAEGRSVINLSWAYGADLEQAVKEAMLKIFDGLNDLGAVIVAAAGNDGETISEVNGYPALFSAEPDPDFAFHNLIVVGAADSDSEKATFSPGIGDITIHAPGDRVNVNKPNGEPDTINSGTSLAAPFVSGLVAYYRGLPGVSDSMQLQDPANVKLLIRKMRRPVLNQNEENEFDLVFQPWNGELMVSEKEHVSCFLHPENPSCPKIDLADPTSIGALCPIGLFGRDLDGQDESNKTIAIRAAACPLPPGNPGGPGGVNNAPTKTIKYTTGTPSPTCTANCGKLCTGYYCLPIPSGTPPDFFPPSLTAPMTSQGQTTTRNVPISTTTKPADPLVIYKMDIAMTGGPTTYTWKIFDTSSNKQVDYCSDNAVIFSKSTDIVASYPPIELGYFNFGVGNGVTLRCMYIPTPDSLDARGHLVCDQGNGTPTTEVGCAVKNPSQAIVCNGVFVETRLICAGN